MIFNDFQLFIDSIESDCDENVENKFKIEYLEMKDKDCWRPLHHACRYGRVELTKLLLSYHCDIHSSTNNGHQSIHLACENGHIDIVKLLIENNCDVNAYDKQGYRPIHLACMFGHTDIVQILILYKSVINKKDRIWGFQPIHLACMHGHIDIVKVLIANKCDINSSLYSGCQPIHLASMNGHIDIVKLLIDKKCVIDKADKIWGYQPIHLSSMHGHIDIVKVLIDNKCDVDAAEKIYECRPIHFACMKDHIDIVKVLIENGCDINALSKCEETPIDIANKNGHYDIIRILKIANIQTIAKAMDLQCGVNCDHYFCSRTLEDDKFRKGELIGEGAFGEVYKYRISNTNREIVIKITRSIFEDRKNIERNINKFSSRIQHKNIVRHFGALEKSGKLGIFMEYMPGGSLKELIDKSGWIGNSNVVKFSKQILKGLEFIHSNGIIHRDIKPANMLLDHDETLKLADFGMSTSLRIESIYETNGKADTLCGTPNYLAPEIILDEPYDFSVDIWSTGASIIHMITGKVPYHSLKPEAVMFRIGTTKKIEFTPYQPISETMPSFIDDLLTPDQSNRPTAEVLLKHPIFFR